MKSGLIICQLHVSKALQNLLGDILLFNYMNDILTAHSDAHYLKRTFHTLLCDLASLDLQVILEKF